MALEIRQLVKSFGDKDVLRAVSFVAQPGIAMGLLGRNGAGKTTTIRIIMDVCPKSAACIPRCRSAANWPISPGCGA